MSKQPNADCSVFEVFEAQNEPQSISNLAFSYGARADIAGWKSSDLLLCVANYSTWSRSGVLNQGYIEECFEVSRYKAFTIDRTLLSGLT